MWLRNSYGMRSGPGDLPVLSDPIAADSSCGVNGCVSSWVHVEVTAAVMTGVKSGGGLRVGERPIFRR